MAVFCCCCMQRIYNSCKGTPAEPSPRSFFFVAFFVVVLLLRLRSFFVIVFFSFRNRPALNHALSFYFVVSLLSHHFRQNSYFSFNFFFLLLLFVLAMCVCVRLLFVFNATICTYLTVHRCCRCRCRCWSACRI